MKKFDVIIIGAGAAGLFCAKLLGERGLSVCVLEQNNRAGKKILISGGGRCNFTNLQVSSKDFYSNNPHFCKSALAQFPSSSFIEFVEKHQIEYYEKKLGQLFCKKSSKLIVEALKKDCVESGVEILLEKKVRRVEKKESLFEIIVGEDKIYKADQVVVASGALSFPQLGTSDLGYRIAQYFEMKVTNLFPSLVPLLYNGFSSLAGISLPVRIKIKDQFIEDDLLFTHKGLSGPAILKASLYWQEEDSLFINLIPSVDLLEKLKKHKSKGKLSIPKILGEFLPTRLLDFLMTKMTFLPHTDLSNLKDKDLEKIEKYICHWEIFPHGSEGYKKAEVTKGGVCTSELSSKSMQAKKVQGLYFIGEVVDVTGLLGGYNFQWAWSSAYAASQSILEGEL